MNNPSPLRYPGGKTAIYPIIAYAIQSNNLHDCTYVEPFAGGAGVSLKLLFDNVVNEVVINDADKAIYSFWRAIIESPGWFIDKIENTPITVQEWRVQRTIWEQATKYSKELGFAAFFLNRTNRSGILSAGPIGGYNQTGNYKIGCRFNKNSLIEKIYNISRFRNRIKVYNQDITILLEKYLPLISKGHDTFIYLDPPYYEKGQRLYLNHFSNEDHTRLKESVSKISCKWIMTYDDQPEIEQLYSDYQVHRFSINYSLSNKAKGGELMIFKDFSCIPSETVIDSLSKSVLFKIAEKDGYPHE